MNSPGQLWGLTHFYRTLISNALYILYVDIKDYKKESFAPRELSHKGAISKFGLIHGIYKYICVGVALYLRSINTYPFLRGQPLPSMDLN